MTNYEISLLHGVAFSTASCTCADDDGGGDDAPKKKRVFLSREGNFDAGEEEKLLNQ
jgi:hypothetical protein